ncbi:hypothetical protein HW555_013319 [Spodoptera exigua]|uniref:Uncharacterized protein n=1 Tax=Spodoptera exigua TaxID=7107 RepID=A0A835G5J4_SPOEX|nr:hypothetical protein HW555_013319 [Spodoptera exigua]
MKCDGLHLSAKYGFFIMAAISAGVRVSSGQPQGWWWVVLGPDEADDMDEIIRNFYNPSPSQTPCPLNSYNLPSLLPWDGRVGEPNGTVLHGHVGTQEVGEALGGGGPVEGEAHGAPVRVLAVADAAVRRRVIAGTYQVLFNLPVGDHGEEYDGVPLGVALGDQHMVWPPTPAEVKLRRLRRTWVARPGRLRGTMYLAIYLFKCVRIIERSPVVGHYLHPAVNLSSSIMARRCSSKVSGAPRSSCTGAMKIRTVPITDWPDVLFTSMLRGKTIHQLMREPGEHGAARREVEPASELHRAELPVRAHRVAPRRALHAHARYTDAWEVQLREADSSWYHQLPIIWIGRVYYQVAMVRVVRVGDEDMSHVVEVAVVPAVGADDGRLHHVAQHVDTALLVQGDLAPSNGEGLDSLHEAIPPGLQLRHVGANLVHGTVQVADGRPGKPEGVTLVKCVRRPGSAGDLRVQLGEVSLLDGLAEVLEAHHAGQAVAHTLHVLSTPVLIDDGTVSRVEGVHQVPVPVVEVDANVFAEPTGVLAVPPAKPGLFQHFKIHDYGKHHLLEGPCSNSELRAYCCLLQKLKIYEIVIRNSIVLLYCIPLTLTPDVTTLLTSLALRNTLGSMNLSGKVSAKVGMLIPLVSGLAAKNKKNDQSTKDGLTHEDVNEFARHDSVFGHEERELLIVGQFHGQRQVGQRDVTHWDSTAGVISKTIGDGALHTETGARSQLVCKLRAMRPDKPGYRIFVVTGGQKY